MNIRAHHLLCMRYFQGKGYSEEFVSNFYKVMKQLENNPVIKVINHPDIICDACPHNVNGRCIKKGPDFENEVKEKDNRIIKHLGLKLNQKATIKELRNLVNLKLPKLKELCKECEWKDYCD